jgi:hypothetical protein
MRASILLLLLFVGGTRALSQPDSLGPRWQDGETAFGFTHVLNFHIDSLQAESNIIAYDRDLFAGRRLHANLKNGAPVGYCTVLYEDGSICEEALFDSVPYIFYFNNCGECYFLDSFMRTTPKWFKKYYRNGILQVEMKFGQAPPRSGLPYIETTRNVYFKNGKPYEINTVTDSLTYWARYDFLLRMSWERKETKDSLIQKSFDYEKGQLQIRRHRRKGRGGEIDSKNFVIDVYALPTGTFLRRDVYVKGKLKS